MPVPTLEDVRADAVRHVDARHGYTCEFAPSPDAHREEYDARERRLMLDALLAREDLLSSRDWPWTTDALRDAYERLVREAAARSDVTA